MAMFHRSILIESAEIDFIKNAAKAKSFFWFVQSMASKQKPLVIQQIVP